nr:hypothetical protein CFP56_63950 [Quercus suber]
MLTTRVSNLRESLDTLQNQSLRIHNNTQTLLNTVQQTVSADDSTGTRYFVSPASKFEPDYRPLRSPLQPVSAFQYGSVASAPKSSDTTTISRAASTSIASANVDTVGTKKSQPSAQHTTSLSNHSAQTSPRLAASDSRHRVILPVNSELKEAFPPTGEPRSQRSAFATSNEATNSSLDASDLTYQSVSTYNGQTQTESDQMPRNRPSSLMTSEFSRLPDMESQEAHASHGLKPRHLFHKDEREDLGIYTERSASNNQLAIIVLRLQSRGPKSHIADDCNDARSVDSHSAVTTSPAAPHGVIEASPDILQARFSLTIFNTIVRGHRYMGPREIAVISLDRKQEIADTTPCFLSIPYRGNCSRFHPAQYWPLVKPSSSHPETLYTGASVQRDADVARFRFVERTAAKRHRSGKAVQEKWRGFAGITRSATFFFLIAWYRREEDEISREVWDRDVFWKCRRNAFDPIVYLALQVRYFDIGDMAQRVKQ